MRNFSAPVYEISWPPNHGPALLVSCPATVAVPGNASVPSSLMPLWHHVCMYTGGWIILAASLQPPCPAAPKSIAMYEYVLVTPGSLLLFSSDVKLVPTCPF